MAKIRDDLRIVSWQAPPRLVPGLIASLVILIICGWVGTFAQADEQRLGGQHPMPMVGKLVKNLDGKNVGTIKDLVINWRASGYIEYAVLSLGGFWGLGEDYVAVPGVALTQVEGQEYFVLDMEREQLRGDPEFVCQFYDRSSVIPSRAGRSSVTGLDPRARSGIGSTLND